jgi:hypothetical protein
VHRTACGKMPGAQVRRRRIHRRRRHRSSQSSARGLRVPLLGPFHAPGSPGYRRQRSM